jgi:glycosyltransferase involved in cell wall biosynthesis
VLFLGEVSFRKGADTLAAAWPLVRARRPRAQCIFAGPIRLTLPDIEGTTFLGSIDGAAAQELIRTARLVVLPSRAEAMPMTLLEAMAWSRPFITTPIAWTAGDAAGGLLVAPDDPEALAEAIVQLLEDPFSSDQAGEQGRAWVEANNGVEGLSGVWADLYDSIARTGP